MPSASATVFRVIIMPFVDAQLPSTITRNANEPCLVHHVLYLPALSASWYRAISRTLEATQAFHSGYVRARQSHNLPSPSQPANTSSDCDCALKQRMHCDLVRMIALEIQTDRRAFHPRSKLDPPYTPSCLAIPYIQQQQRDRVSRKE